MSTFLLTEIGFHRKVRTVASARNAIYWPSRLYLLLLPHSRILTKFHRLVLQVVKLSIVILVNNYSAMAAFVVFSLRFLAMSTKTKRHHSIGWNVSQPYFVPFRPHPDSPRHRRLQGERANLTASQTTLQTLSVNSSPASTNTHPAVQMYQPLTVARLHSPSAKCSS